MVAGCWLLVVGCWLLVAGCWLLVSYGSNGLHTTGDLAACDGSHRSGVRRDAFISDPKDELYGLVSQTRRAAVSIPSNIAEGQGRGSSREFVRFLAVARGSLCELQTQILLAERFKYIDAERSGKLMEQSWTVGRLINGLIRSIAPPAEGQ